MCGGSHQCFGGSLGEKAVFGSCRVLLLAKSQPVFRWLALARRRFSGVVVCWSDRSHSVLVARFDEEALVGGQELMGAKITAFLVAIYLVRRQFWGVVYLWELYIVTSMSQRCGAWPRV